MNTREALEPTDERPPAAWRAAAVVAAAVTLVVVLGSRGLLGVAAQVAQELGLTSALVVPLGRLAPVLGLLAAVALSGVVLLALRLPWLALALVVCGLLPLVLLGGRAPTAALVLLAAVSVAGSWRRPLVGVLATGLALLVLVAGLVEGMLTTGPVGPFENVVLLSRGAGAVLQAVVLCAVLWLTLAARRQVGLAQQRDRDLAGLAGRASAVEEQSAVTAERARLARDLHDVVAHHVSLIAVRAETAPYTHPGLGADARSVLAEIAADARRALDELRSVLGILGRSTAEERQPQPTWRDIGGLVERAVASGERVELAGDVGADVDPTVGYVAYRVVQEGLTNARKHAPGAAVAVRLERTSHLAVVSVVSSGVSSGAPAGRSPAPGASERATDPASDPASRPAPAETAPISGLPWRDAEAGAPDVVPPTVVDPAAAHGTDRTSGRPSDGVRPTATGHGLVGMRERVEALGGRLVVDRRAGAFVVEATLPLDRGARR